MELVTHESIKREFKNPFWVKGGWVHNKKSILLTFKFEKQTIIQEFCHFPRLHTDSFEEFSRNVLNFWDKPCEFDHPSFNFAQKQLILKKKGEFKLSTKPVKIQGLCSMSSPPAPEYRTLKVKYQKESFDDFIPFLQSLLKAGHEKLRIDFNQLLTLEQTQRFWDLCSSFQNKIDYLEDPTMFKQLLHLKQIPIALDECLEEFLKGEKSFFKPKAIIFRPWVHSQKLLDSFSGEIVISSCFEEEHGFIDVIQFAKQYPGQTHGLGTFPFEKNFSFFKKNKDEISIRTLS